ncbi:MAG: hypothetical protein JNL67_04940 [Planctomycetaceae bacterium]|nr:hypothetical protein [Planctomycetaceae bacterium]
MAARFDPVQGTEATAAHTCDEVSLYPQAPCGSVVDNSWERIGITGNHPIWSEDRQDYIDAMELRVVAGLKNLQGDIV